MTRTATTSSATHRVRRTASRPSPLTTVMDRTQVKVVAWYDNEWGYANRLVELAERVLAPVPLKA
jgi:glyceraldehyde-3-phosphate dehydrogenase/erythrose-4-phosphate dehydrogenase